MNLRIECRLSEGGGGSLCFHKRLAVPSSDDQFSRVLSFIEHT